MGGIARVLTELANEWVKSELNITFISCLQGNRHYQLDNKIHFIEPEFKRSSSFFNKLIFYPRLIVFIYKNVKKEKPHAVLSFGDVFNPIVLLSLWFVRIPVFISDRTSPDYKHSTFIKLLKKFTYSRSDGMLCQTKHAQKYKLKEYGNQLNTFVIDNPVRKINIKEGARENFILYVGRFAWEKGPDRLIHAFSQLKRQCDWRLIMAGDGPLLAEMKLLAKKLEVEDKIEFPGKVKDVDALYSKASVFVLPSRVEGFPNALCEAMIAGLPVICFDGFPADEIIHHNYDGIILKDGDIDMLSKTIQTLIDKPEERIRLGKNASIIFERLNVRNISTQLIRYIESETLRNK
ncbi:MAG TPA: glycosyltransferase [Saprospiraceae bacterium]|nr:glycosyltransferase [Saprospiraceae bacterium]